MKKLEWKKFEKKLIIIFIILGIIVVLGIILLIKNTNNNESNSVKDQEVNQKQCLDDSTLWLPDNCNLYSQIPEFTFSSENGDLHSIKDFQGKVLIVTFWASWCPDCNQEMPLIKEFQKITEKYDNVEIILIDKLDNNKETKEKAKQYLKANNINIETYYDDGLAAYNMLGMHNIPTTLFIDEQGVLKAWYPKQITEKSVFEAYLLNTVEGSDATTGDFIINQMMDDDGGIHSAYDTDKVVTFKSDVLSESQGAMLESAVLKEDKKLFDKMLGYINSFMKTDGLTAWKVTNGDTSKTNALIDDFRIYRTLTEANNKWGGYDQSIKEYEEDLKKYSIANNNFVDFYEGESKSYANRLTLCYADFQAMKILKTKYTEFQEPSENAIKIVRNGLISEDFPLYYSWYNYDEGKYEKDDLNMVEEMVTLLNLARVDLLPEETIAWLKESMDNEGIKSRYSVEGKVVEGYQYDSTAVYALVAMIADEIGDMNLRADALKKMEIMRINDTSLAYNGAFGLQDGSGILSFDQIMPILAYEYASK